MNNHNVYGLISQFFVACPIEPVEIKLSHVDQKRGCYSVFLEYVKSFLRCPEEESNGNGFQFKYFGGKKFKKNRVLRKQIRQQTPQKPKAGLRYPSL